jgi:hypothetical protein
MRANDLRANDEPKCEKSNTATEEDIRAKLLTDNELPRCAQSRTDRENTEPILAKPRSETDDPSRATLLKANDEPRCRKSSTDIELPRRATLRSDMEDPR